MPASPRPRSRPRSSGDADRARKEGAQRSPAGIAQWTRNPVARCGKRYETLVEMWLAGVPIRVGRDKQIAPPTKLLRTPPPNIKHALAAMAIAEEQELERRQESAAPEIEAALERAQAGAEAEMKKLGYTDAQIAAHFQELV